MLQSLGKFLNMKAQTLYPYLSFSSAHLLLRTEPEGELVEIPSYEMRQSLQYPRTLNMSKCRAVSSNKVMLVSQLVGYCDISIFNIYNSFLNYRALITLS